MDEIKKADALQPQAGRQSRPRLIQSNSSCLQTHAVKSLGPQHSKLLCCKSKSVSTGLHCLPTELYPIPSKTSILGSHNQINHLIRLSKTAEVHREWDSTTANSAFVKPDPVSQSKTQMPLPMHHTEQWCLRVAEQKHGHLLGQPRSAQISAFNHLSTRVS